MRKILFALMFILCLAVPSAQAITVNSDIDTDLGDIATGTSVSYTLTASDYEASDPSAITWLIKVNSGSNPGFRLDRRRGDTVKLNAPSLNRPGGMGNFSLTVTAQDTTETGTIEITGRVVNKPVIKTDSLPNASAGAEKKYLKRIETNSGIEPIDLIISGDFPEGLVFSEAELQGRNYHVITGTTDQLGTFNFDLIARNNVGSDMRAFTLQVDPVRPKIKTPKDFPREYIVHAGQPFMIDVSGFEFSGTKPLNIGIDERGKSLGINYDTARKAIIGNIPAGTKTRRTSIRLQSANAYDEKPAEIKFTLNILSPAADIRMTPANNKMQTITENDTKINAVPLYLGKSFRTQFKADVGSLPITWDFVITSMDEKLDGKKIVKDLGGKFGGLVFSADGTIQGIPDKAGNVVFVPEATNSIAVTRADVCDFVFGRAPSFDKGKLSAGVNLLNGQSETINVSDYLVPMNNGRFATTIKVTGDFPPGMSFDGTSIKGIPMALSLEHLKKYQLSLSASNAFGTAWGRLTLTLQDLPRIGEVPDVVTGRKGRRFRYAIPSVVRRPYTWRMVYKNEEVTGEIGDSGIVWNPKNGTLAGDSNIILDGTYRVTVYLANDVGQDSRTFTIKINP